MERSGRAGHRLLGGLSLHGSHFGRLLVAFARFTQKADDTFDAVTALGLAATRCIDVARSLRAPCDCGFYVDMSKSVAGAYNHNAPRMTL